VTSGVGLVAVPVGLLVLRAVLNGVLAAAAAWGVRALYLRFGPAERTDW
jgi:uncharacterized integral membrane protein